MSSKGWPGAGVGVSMLSVGINIMFGELMALSIYSGHFRSLINFLGAVCITNNLNAHVYTLFVSFCSWKY